MTTTGEQVATQHTELAESGAPTIAGSLVLAAITAGFVAQGGTFGRGRLLLGVLLAAAVAAAFAGHTFDRWRTALPVASAALAGWVLLRATLDGHIGAASGAVGLLTAIVAAYLIVRSEGVSARRSLATGLVLLGAALALSGWVGVALRWEPLALAPAGVWRAATLITYANASAAILVALALIAIGLLAERHSRVLAVAAMMLVLGAAATLSRAGALAAVAGLMVLGGLLGWRRLATTMTGPAVGAAVAFAGLVPSMSASSGAQPALALAALAIAVPVTIVTRPRGRLLVGAVACAAAVLVAGAVVSGPGGLSTRLVPADRLERAEAAVDLWLEQPVMGVGAGPLWLSWEDDRGRSVGAWYVHNEYLQALVQFGAVGGVLLLLLLGAIARTLHRGGEGPVPRVLWAGTAAAIAAVAVHSAFDFLWHVPAIPVLAAALIGIGAPPAARQTRNRKGQNA